jgi:hypothetical protein|tara:strand:- start:192 stop:770 length:579 start_codon:yes stop_codon:yes gene_type:complete
MIKKILGLLFLPYLLFMFLEGCFRNYCDRKETRNITKIEMYHEKDTVSLNETILLEMEYESYFVNNFKLDILPKASSKSVSFDPCFEGFSNPIQVVSIISSSNFNAGHMAGSELNSLFGQSNSRDNLDEFNYQPNEKLNDWEDNKINFYNDDLPTLDSIHTLYFNIYCADGKTYRDTLPNVNLNRTRTRYHY